MDVVGLGFGVVAEARTVAQNIVRRSRKLPSGPKNVQSLSDSLANSAHIIDEVDTLPPAFLMGFRRTLPLCSTAL